MSGSGVLLGGLNVALYCAIIIFIAVMIVKFLGPFDGQMMYWGKVIVVLLCIIAIAGWLFSIGGLWSGGGLYSTPHFLR